VDNLRRTAPHDGPAPYTSCLTVSPELERKVRQLDNEVAATDTMIAELAGTQRRHGTQLEEISAMQTEHSGSLAQHGVKLDAILEILRAR